MALQLIGNIKGPKGDGVKNPRLSGDNLVVDEVTAGVAVARTLGNVRGATGTKGDQGLPGFEAVPTAEGIAQNVTLPGPTRDALEATVGTRIVATAARFAGIDPTGATDSTTAINNAIKEHIARVGSELVIPAGTYRLSGSTPLQNVDSGGSRASVNIDWSAAEFVLDGAASSVLELLGPTPTMHAAAGGPAVTSVAMENTLALAGVTVTFADTSFASTWQRGDVVKVIADDVIPGAQPGAGSNQPRVAQSLTLHSRTSTTLTLIGVLEDSYTTNVRVARLDGSVRVSSKSGRVRFSDAVIASGTARNSIVLRNLVYPQIDQPVIEAANGPMVVVAGCYGATIRGAAIHFGVDNPTASNLSYGILDQSSMYTQVTGARGRNLRHLYTDDTSEIAAGSTSTHAYGRTMFAKVIGSSGDGSSAAVFDTHHASYGAEFIGCTAVNSYFGFQLRGRRGSIVDGRAFNCVVGGRIFSQSAGGTTQGSSIVNWEDVNCGAGLRIDMNPAGHPNAGVRETEPITISGFKSDGAANRALEIRNATVFLNDAYLRPAAAVVDGTPIVSGRNSRIVFSGGLVFDMMRNVSGTDIKLIDLDVDTSNVLEVIGTARWLAPSSDPSRIASVLRCSGADIVRVELFNLSYHSTTFTVIDGVPASGSHFDWVNGTTTRSSAALNLGTTSSADATAIRPIGLSRQADLSLFVNASGGDSFLANLPAPQFDGQVLRVINYGANATPRTVRLTHDPSTTGARRKLIDGAQQAIPEGKSLTLTAIPGGIWQQTTPVA